MTTVGAARTAAEWFEAGRAHRRGGLLAEARSALWEAAVAAQRAGDHDLLAAAAVDVGGLWVYEQRDVLDRARLAALWEHASAVARPGSPTAALLTVRMAAEAVYEGGPLSAVEAAVDDVRAAGDDAAVAEALSLLHHVLLDAAHAHRRLEVARELLQRAALLDDPLPALMGLCWRTVDLYLLGDPRARQSRVELAERTTVEGCEALAFIADVLSAMETARAGDLGASEAAAGAALTRGLTAGDPDAPAYYGALLTAVRWWQGRAEEMLTLVRSEAMAPRLGGNAVVYDAADAMLSAIAGDLDGSAEAVQRVTARPLAEAPLSSARLTGLFLLGETAFLTGDHLLAAAVAEEVAPHAALPVMPSLAVVCLGSARRTLGLTSAVGGHLDEAVAHLDAAIADDRRLGNRPMGLLTTHALAAVLRLRGATGDLARARDLEAAVEHKAAAAGMTVGALPAWLADELAGGRQSTSEPAPPSAAGLRVRRRGNGWVLTHSGGTTVLPDLIGFAYLGVLLDNPGVDVPVLALAGAAPGAVLAAGPGATAAPTVDGPARRAYRSRMRELSAALDRADTGTDTRRAAEAELAHLRDALSAATGLGGRWRSFPTDHERARTAVRKAVRRAIDTIAAAEPAVGAHLRAAVSTGSRCRYDPLAVVPSDGTTAARHHQ